MVCSAKKTMMKLGPQSIPDYFVKGNICCLVGWRTACGTALDCYVLLLRSNVFESEMTKLGLGNTGEPVNAAKRMLE